MKLTGFDHIVLCVADVARTVAFYQDLLGMEPVEERPGKWALRFGDQKISLQQDGAAPAMAAGTVPGSGNFCILAETPIEALAATLEAANIEILNQGRRIGATGPIRSVYFRDPDGNLVEISNRVA